MGGHYKGHFATNTRGNCNFLPMFEVKVTVQNISTAATSNIFSRSDYYERTTASKCGPCLQPLSRIVSPYTPDWDRGQSTHPGCRVRLWDTREVICGMNGWWELHLSPTVTSHYWQECHNTAEAGGWWGVNCDGPVSLSSPAPGPGM